MRRNVLTAHHLAERLQWCQEHVRWRRAHWRIVLFFDEFRIMSRWTFQNLSISMNIMPPIVVHGRFGSGSVMVWEENHHDGHAVLVRVNAQIFGDEILQHHVVPLIKVISSIFQHNAKPHTARVCRDFHVLPRPAGSADLSPIE